MMVFFLAVQKKKRKNFGIITKDNLLIDSTDSCPFLSIVIYQ